MTAILISHCAESADARAFFVTNPLGNPKLKWMSALPCCRQLRIEIAENAAFPGTEP